VLELVKVGECIDRIRSALHVRVRMCREDGSAAGSDTIQMLVRLACELEHVVGQGEYAVAACVVLASLTMTWGRAR
jgi:hypothetical protein